MGAGHQLRRTGGQLAADIFEKYRTLCHWQHAVLIERVCTCLGGKVDVVISNLTITPQRNLRVAFVGPYLKSGKCIVTRDEALAKADGKTDLNTSGTRLVVLDGSTSADFARELLPEATLIKVNDYERGAELVKNDEAGGLLTDFPICTAVLKANPDAGFVSVFSLLTYEPIGIALPAEDPLFINWTQNFLDRMEGTNGLQQLGKRWFGQARLVRKSQ